MDCNDSSNLMEEKKWWENYKPEYCGGGAKKFLYTGPHTRKSSLFEDDVVATKWPSPRSEKNHETSAQKSEFDVEGVWGLKHMNVHGTTASKHKPGAQEGWTMNANKGFYSRHGMLDDNDNTHSMNQKNNDNTGKQWGGQNNKLYSYSYTGSPTEQLKSPSQMSMMSLQNTPRGGAMSNGSMVYNSSSMYNNTGGAPNQGNKYGGVHKGAGLNNHPKPF